jgi:hypothetical protein
VLFHQLDCRRDVPDACSLDRHHRWVLRSQNGVTRVVYVSEFKGRSVSVVLHYVTVSVNMKGADVFVTPNVMESHRLLGMLFVTESRTDVI